MLINCPWCCCAVTFVLYLTACAVPVVSSDDVDPKRPWDMVRINRGLNMLRLGKRFNSGLPMLRLGKRDPNENKLSLTDEEIRQLIEILSGESRDPTRRQPPLPRYGRELLTRRELLELLERTIYMRPPPRAGRYKRSVIDEDTFNRIRSVVRPRIGRYIRPVHLQTKAISRPRIGRDQLFPTNNPEGASDDLMGVYQ